MTVTAGSSLWARQMKKFKVRLLASAISTSTLEQGIHSLLGAASMNRAARLTLQLLGMSSVCQMSRHFS